MDLRRGRRPHAAAARRGSGFTSFSRRTAWAISLTRPAAAPLRTRTLPRTPQARRPAKRRPRSTRCSRRRPPASPPGRPRLSNVSMTYAELDAAANRLAHHLRAAGAEPGACVALCVERSADTGTGLLGI
ncbi:MAG: AMP-binding protein [Polyangiaceae bacterium]